ncbi:hypothetical protein CC79DRAFT_187959 [Sarocladium strictum]
MTIVLITLRHNYTQDWAPLSDEHFTNNLEVATDARPGSKEAVASIETPNAGALRTSLVFYRVYVKSTTQALELNASQGWRRHICLFIIDLDLCALFLGESEFPMTWGPCRNTFHCKEPVRPPFIPSFSLAGAHATTSFHLLPSQHPPALACHQPPSSVVQPPITAKQVFPCEPPRANLMKCTRKDRQCEVFLLP